MIVETTVCGLLDIDEQEIIQFTHGLPGFEELRRFVLVHQEPDAPFSYLQSVERGELAFIVVNPFSFFTDYEFDLAEADEEELRVEREDQLVILSILTVSEDIRDATANLMAPVVINKERKKGKQVILHEGKYTTRHKLISAAGDAVRPEKG